MLLREQLLPPTQLRFPKTSSKLFVWGLGTSGQVGFPSYNISIAQLSAGSSHAIALTSDNRLFAWGLNSSGQLGDGTTINKSFPVQIGVRGGWKNISAGANFSMAVRGDGSLFAWGLGTSGQLGDGSTISKSSPIQVTSSFLSDVIWNNVYAGALHTLAYDNRGLLYAWGDNSVGQLGEGHVTDRSTPAQIFSVVDTSSNSNSHVITKFGTRYSTSIVPITGSVSGWFGGTGYIQVNDNTVLEPGSGNFTIELFFYATVFGTWNTLVHKGNTGVFAAYYITINSGVLTFYSSSNGTSWDIASALTFGTASLNTWNHVAMSRVGTSIFLFLNGNLGRTISVGSTALLDNIQKVAIGARNDNTELFTGYISNVRIVKGVGVYSGAFTVPTSILTSTQSAGAQGSNINAITGSQTSLLLYTTLNAAISQNSWSQISAGASFSAAVEYVSGRLFTWGLNTSGQLGLTNINSPNGDTINRSVPVQVGTNSWRLVSAGTGHTAAIRDNNTLYTWGLNSSFQLGLTDTGASGNSINRSAPVQVTTGSSNGSWKNVSAGNAFTLAIADDNTLYSWGRNQEGQTGFQNSTTLRSTPQQITTGSWSLISAGSSFSAATNNNKLLFTWGAGAGGTQADGTTINRSSPVLIGISSTVTQSSPVQIGTNSWTSISGGSTFFAAVRSDKLLFTWGLNSSGQLGDNTSINKSSPVQVGTSSWNAVAAGSGNQIFAIRLDGTLWTWGAATTAIQTGGNAPTTSWKQITVNANMSLALRSDNNLYGWGENQFGQLGQGDTVNRSNPTLINHPNSPTKTWKKIGENNNQNNIVAAIDSDDKLYMWGRNLQGQLADGTTVDKSTPTQVMADKNWLMISGSKGITTDYLLWGWGINTLGEVGDGTTVNRSSPVNLSAESGTVVSFTMITGTSQSAGHNFALSISNKLYGWGQNNTGQLGNNTTTNRSAPTVLVSPFDTYSWSMVSVGNMDGVGTQGGHTLAIRSDGTLYAWGINASGQIGDNTVVNKSSPVLVTLNYTDVPVSWAAVAGANSRSVAIDVDGYLWSWGYNAVHGAVGDGTTVNKSKPVLVTSALTWSKIASGYFHTNAITEDGYMYGWGSNNLGNQGNGTTTARSSPVVIQTVATALSSPVQVPSGLSNYTQIRTNTSAHAAITSDGSLYTWGTNAAGQLGTGTTFNRTIPRKLDTNSWTQVSMGINHALAIRGNNMYAWGGNAGYQLGDTSNVNKSSPVQVGATYAGQPLSWAQVSAGASHSLAIDTNSKLYGWGLNSVGQLGIITESFSWTQIDSGGAFSLAIRQDNTLWSWGTNTNGVLGIGDTLNRSSPTQIGNLSNYTQISVTKNVTSAAAAINSSGALFMWGNNASGQLGDNTIINKSTPVQIPGSWNQVSVGTSHTLAIDSTGRLFGWGLSTALNSSTAPFSWTVVSENTSHVVAVRSDGLLFAWGLNSSGQVGDNTTITKSSPIQIGSSNWITASAGQNHTLAITNDYRLFAWGGNASGHLGINLLTNRSSPVQVTSPAVSWIQVDAANSFSMGITSTNSLYVWGLGSSGQLGTLTEILSWNTISAGLSNSLAIRNNGRLYGWGFNTSGQLGDNTAVTKSSPVQVSGTLSWNQISTSLNYSLGIPTTGELYAWGNNAQGQLGNNTTLNRSNPTLISSSSWASVSAGKSDFAFAIRNDNTLWAWGNNTTSIGITNVATSWQQVSEGIGHSLALRSDGALFAWGLGLSGQLGYGTAANRSSPVQIGSLSNWSMVSADRDISSALNTLGEIYVWGLNTSGQLGLNDSVNRSSPVLLTTNTGSWIFTACSRGITNDGKLWSWGINSGGQLGDGTTVNKSSPVNIIAGTSFTFVTPHSTSRNFAISNLGQLFAWGGNVGGSLGDGTTVAKSTPVQITSPAVSWSMVKTSGNNIGVAHTLAITTTGLLYAWGTNTSGQLGDGTTIDKSSPVSIGTSSWVAATTWANNSHAVDNTGNLFGWGNNIYLGLNTAIQYSSPVQITAGISTNSWRIISSSSEPNNGSLLLIRDDGIIFGWGANEVGQLGDGTTVNISVPTRITPFTPNASSPVQIGNSSNWSVISAGISNQAGITSDGSLYTWGTNTSGQLGIGDTIARNITFKVGNSSWSQVSVGNSHTLAIGSTGLLYAWGINAGFQLGDNSSINRSSPIQIGTSSWTSVSAGLDHSMAIRADGTLWGWGSNSIGQVGKITDVFSWSAVGLGGAGNQNNFAIRSDGLLFGWGLNTSGQLGVNDVINRSSPVQIGNQTWSTIAYSSSHTMAIRSNGQLWVWGGNNNGQLGINDTIARSNPVQLSVPVQLATTSWIAISCGSFHSAGITANNLLYTWGLNASGQLGYHLQGQPFSQDTINRSSPVLVPSSWTKVAAGGSHTAAINNLASLYSWGSNDTGQLGINLTLNRSSPVLLTAPFSTYSYTQVDAFTSYTLAVRDNGAIYGWGLNSSGELGNDNTINKSSPVLVSGTTSFTNVRARGSNYATATDGSIWVWGINASGSLGINDAINRSNPVQLPFSVSFNVIGGTGSTPLAIGSNGLLYTWGSGSTGALGVVSNTTQSRPVQIGGNLDINTRSPVQIPGSWSQVSAGNQFTLARDTNGILYAWGQDTTGQLGF